MKERLLKTPYGKMYVRIDHEKRNTTIIFLHGWSMNSETFDSLVPKLSNYRIIRIDFPGFGKSDVPNKAMKLSDYVKCLEAVINQYLMSTKNRIILVGHSFGGRVGIEYCSTHKFDRLFLVNAKALANHSFKKRIKIIKYKVKKLLLKLINKNKYQEYVNTSGSPDYQALSGVMRKTFSNIVNYDLKKSLKRIKGRVIVMGSVNDDTVPLEETKTIYKLLDNSVLYTFHDSKHFSYIDEESKVVSIIRKEIS